MPNRRYTHGKARTDLNPELICIYGGPKDFERAFKGGVNMCKLFPASAVCRPRQVLAWRTSICFLMTKPQRGRAGRRSACRKRLGPAANASRRWLPGLYHRRPPHPSAFDGRLQGGRRDGDAILRGHEAARPRSAALAARTLGLRLHDLHASAERDLATRSNPSFN